jgi:hypothetical protein
MPRMGFEPTTPALERGKTVNVLDWAATVIGYLVSLPKSTLLVPKMFLSLIFSPKVQHMTQKKNILT